MHELVKSLSYFENKLNNLYKVNNRVSASSVGWHIEHSLLVIIEIIEALKQSDNTAYKWKFSFCICCTRIIRFLGDV